MCSKETAFLQGLKLFLFFFFFGIFLSLMLLTYIFHKLAEGELNNVLTFSTLIVAIIPLSTVHIVVKQVQLLLRILRSFTKKGEMYILINYIGIDKYWQEWAEYEFGRLDYRVLVLKWDNEGRFIEKLSTAEKKVKRTLSIVSTETVEMLENLEQQWFHNWKSRNHIGGVNALLCVRSAAFTKLQGYDKELRFLDFADGTEKIIKEDEAKNQLALWLTENNRQPQWTERKETQKEKCRYPGALPKGWNLLERNQNFSGREVLLARLQKKLASGNAKFLLSGFAGSGKTEIAREYAYRNYDRYSYIFWLDLETPQYRNQLKEIITELEIPQGGLQQDEDAFIDWLSQQDGWLLIIDGCKDPQRIKKFYTKPLNGKVLITACMGATAFKIQPENEIKVGCMAENEAVKLMRSYVFAADQIFSAGKERAIKAIVNKLGRAPEALLAASLYIESNKCSPEQYFQDYREAREEYAQKKKTLGSQAYANQVPEEQVDIIYAWWFYFDEVQRKSPEAAKILHYCCMLDSVIIYREIIENIPNLSISGSKLTKMIGDLARDCLIQADNEYNNFSVEPHIKNFFQDRLDQDTKKDLFIGIIQALSKTLEDISIPSIQRADVYAVQFETCKDFIQRWKIEQPEIVDLYDSYGRYLVERARYEEAEKLLKESLRLREEFDQPVQGGSISSVNEEQLKLKKATNMSHKADLLYGQGKYKEAKQLLETQVLPVREGAPGQDYIAIAMTYYKLIRICNALGQKSTDAEFEGFCQKREATWQKVQNKSQSITIALLKQEASIRYMQGNYEESIRCYEAVIKLIQDTESKCSYIEKEAFDIEKHIYKGQIGLCLFKLKRETEYGNIELLYIKVLDIYEKTFGQNHPYSAQAYNNIASLYKRQNNYHLAKEYYNKSLKIYKSIQKDHPSIKKVKTWIDELPI